MLYNDEMMRLKYKYITSVSVSEDDAEEYRSYLKSCESLGFSYYLYFFNDRIVGFSDFKLKELQESDVIDLSKFDSDEIYRIFCKIFKEDGYFLVSDNSIKADTYEERLYKDIANKTKLAESKPKLRLIK